MTPSQLSLLRGVLAVMDTNARIEVRTRSKRISFDAISQFDEFIVSTTLSEISSIVLKFDDDDANDDDLLSELAPRDVSSLAEAQRRREVLTQSEPASQREDSESVKRLTSFDVRGLVEAHGSASSALGGSIVEAHRSHSARDDDLAGSAQDERSPDERGP